MAKLWSTSSHQLLTLFTKCGLSKAQIAKNGMNSLFPRNLATVQSSKPLLYSDKYTAYLKDLFTSVFLGKPVKAKPFKRSLLCFSVFPLFPTKKKDISQNVDIPSEVFLKEVLLKPAQRGKVSQWIYQIWDGLRLFIRLLQITCMFAPLLCFYPVTYMSDGVCMKWWKTLIWMMERSGPTFIKLGQWAGTRRDMFSRKFCDLCSRLHNNTREHSWAMTKLRLRKAFGKRWREIFVCIEKKPIGSGCIAQVHRAYMRASMIPDESLVDEILSLDDDSDDGDIDLAQGLEIMGLLKSVDDGDDGDEDFPQLQRYQATGTIPEGDQSEMFFKHQNVLLQFGDIEAFGVVQTEDGELLLPVAIKVLHPGVYKHVQRDLSILRKLSRLAETLVPSLKWLSLRESMEEFGHLLTRQVDLRFEADTLEQFVENFERNPNIQFPRPIRPYCKRGVLVETLQDGEPISKYLVEDPEPQGEAIQTPGVIDADPSASSSAMSFNQMALKQKLAVYGVEALLQMVFVHNFVHGDLHPGNILVQKAEQFDPEDSSRLLMVDLCDTVIVSPALVQPPVQLVLLDTGIVSQLADSDLTNLRKVFMAVITGDGEEVADLMLRHSRYNECSDVTGFKQELGDLVCRYRQDKLQLGKVQVGELLSEVFSTCIRHKVKMESNFASVMLAIFVLEGLGRSLDPELDILEKAKPILLGL